MRPSLQLALGTGLLSAAGGFLYYDLTHSNRPHELRFIWLVLGLLAATVMLGGAAVRGAWRSRGAAGHGRTWTILPGGVLLIALAAGLLLLAALAAA